MGRRCGKREVSRRALVKAGLGGLLVGGAAGLYGMLRSLVPTVSYEPPRILTTRPPAELALAGVSDFQVADRKVSVIRGDGGLYALVRNCTHMGCVPNLDPGDQCFHCPCHGSVFTLSGDVARGPAPEPLFRAALRLDARGFVVIDAGRLENDPVRRQAPPFVLPV